MGRRSAQNRAAMSLNRLVLTSVGLVLLGRGAVGLERPGLSQYDRVLLCARKAFGKPVIGFAHWPRIDDAECSDSAEGMRATFEAKGLRVLELDDWVYLIPDPIDGKEDLVVEPYDESESGTVRYRIKDGHYSRVEPSRSASERR
jgi:hypothetical protein